MMREDQGVMLLTLVLPTALILAVGGFVWWHVHYKCVESHEERRFRTSCSTFNSRTDCHTYPTTVRVCDQWEER
jgi:hypothetical protein